MCNINLAPIQKSTVQSYVNSSPNPFTVTNIESINLSVQGFTFQFNGALRANLEIDNMSSFIRELDNAFIQSQLLHPITVYRVCNYQEMLWTLNNNKYIDYGYMSTSKSSVTVQRFFEDPKYGYFPALLTIKIPKGANVIEIDKIIDFENTTYEDEVLIKRRAKFDVISNEDIPTKNLEKRIGKSMVEKYESIRILEMNFIEYLRVL
jgi:hypothetical protein